MSKAIDNLKAAFEEGMKNRPKVGGFPFLAETLRSFGVSRNIWNLPSCQSIYITTDGPVVMQGEVLLMGFDIVPSFNPEALIHALRTDQAGGSTFPEFLKAAWSAGVVSYDVDFEKRSVSYFGVKGEVYIEEYAAI